MALVSTVYPPEIWSLMSLRILRDELVMARLIHRDFEPDVANRGDRIHTRKPTKLTARTWAGQTGTNADSQIEVDNLNARDLSIVLDSLVYAAWLVEDRDAATTVKNLQEEFLLPAMDPISQRIDDDIMSEFTSASSTDVEGNAVSATAFDVVGAGAAMNEDDVVDARETLNTAQCPPQRRKLVVSAGHEADLLRSALFVQADQSGSTDALTAGRLGTKFGFEIFMSQNVPTAVDTDSTAQSLAFHPEAIALVTRPLPAVPASHGAVSATRAIDDIALRFTSAYDPRYKGITASLDILYGVQLLDANLATIVNP
jgi:N4-gp56 family major capsid protein